MKSKLLLLILGFVAFSNAWAASTSSRVIDRIKIDGDDGYYYFTSTTNDWGVAGCGAKYYVYIVPAQVVDQQAMLSVAIAAKMGGVEVTFTGTCDQNEYFRATEIWLN